MAAGVLSDLELLLQPCGRLTPGTPGTPGEGGAGDGGQLGQRRRDAALRRREEARKQRRLRKMKAAAPLVVGTILASVKLQRKVNV